MAKKKVKKAVAKKGLYPYSYPRVYSLVLWNTGGEDHGSTFAVLYTLVQGEITRLSKCVDLIPSDGDVATLKSLMIIRDQLDEEFHKGRD